eukprot:SAG25_NODE_519_length_7241_cov_159.775553_2_plen_1269_part_00
MAKDIAATDELKQRLQMESPRLTEVRSDHEHSSQSRISVSVGAKTEPEEIKSQDGLPPENMAAPVDRFRRQISLVVDDAVEVVEPPVRFCAVAHGELLAEKDLLSAQVGVYAAGEELVVSRRAALGDTWRVYCEAADGWASLVGLDGRHLLELAREQHPGKLKAAEVADISPQARAAVSDVKLAVWRQLQAQWLNSSPATEMTVQAPSTSTPDDGAAMVGPRDEGLEASDDEAQEEMDLQTRSPEPEMQAPASQKLATAQSALLTRWEELTEAVVVAVNFAGKVLHDPPDKLALIGWDTQLQLTQQAKLWERMAQKYHRLEQWPRCALFGALALAVATQEQEDQQLEQQSANELSELPLQELRARAKAAGLRVRATTLKPQLIQQMMEHQVSAQPIEQCSRSSKAWSLPSTLIRYVEQAVERYEAANKGRDWLEWAMDFAQMRPAEEVVAKPPSPKPAEPLVTVTTKPRPQPRRRRKSKPVSKIPLRMNRAAELSASARRERKDEINGTTSTVWSTPQSRQQSPSRLFTHASDTPSGGWANTPTRTARRQFLAATDGLAGVGGGTFIASPGISRMTLELTVIAAKNLATVDGSEPRPYAVVSCGDVKHKTEAIQRTTAPIWPCEHFCLSDVASHEVVHVEIFSGQAATKDTSQVSQKDFFEPWESDESLGYVQLSWSDQPSTMTGEELYLTLQPTTRCPVPRGQLCLRCAVLSDGGEHTGSQVQQPEHDAVLQLLWKAIHRRRTRTSSNRSHETHDLRSFFRALDGDGSRVVTRSELRQAMQALAVPVVTPLQLRQLLASMDTDHSGSVSFPEFERWMTRGQHHGHSRVGPRRSHRESPNSAGPGWDSRPLRRSNYRGKVPSPLDGPVPPLSGTRSRQKKQQQQQQTRKKAHGGKAPQRSDPHRGGMNRFERKMEAAKEEEQRAVRMAAGAAARQQQQQQQQQQEEAEVARAAAQAQATLEAQQAELAREAEQAAAAAAAAAAAEQEAKARAVAEEAERAEVEAERAGFATRAALEEASASESRDDAALAHVGGSEEATSAAMGKDKMYAQMDELEQECILELGWTAEGWDAGDEEPFEKPWSSLRENEQDAAKTLGLDHRDFAARETAAEGVARGAPHPDGEAQRQPNAPAPAPAPAGESPPPGVGIIGRASLTESVSIGQHPSQARISVASMSTPAPAPQLTPELATTPSYSPGVTALDFVDAEHSTGSAALMGARSLDADMAAFLADSDDEGALLRQGLQQIAGDDTLSEDPFAELEAVITPRRG